MLLDPTHVRFKRSSEHACDQWHSSRVFTPLIVAIINYVETLKARTVAKYHGAMSPGPRKEAHVAFLTGTAPVIVARCSFLNRQLPPMMLFMIPQGATFSLACI
jgi:hypothetical protein